MNLRNTYLNAASGLSNPAVFSGVRQVGWRSPSNIALIKYWGKKPVQLPQNGSLSFTLSQSYTETTIDYSCHGGEVFSLEFFFEGKPEKYFESRIRTYLESVIDYLPFLNGLHLKIRSGNSFPHSSGIASSASSLSALALCLLQIENDLCGTLSDVDAFYQKASFLARLGSGSAARSVYGGFVVWGETDALPGSTDEAGQVFEVPRTNTFGTLNDAILITSKKKKDVSSTAGHGMMEHHPYAEARYQQAQVNMSELIGAIREENDDNFIRIIENEALSLHALMLSSDPGYTLLNQNTWHIINKIREIRKKEGLFLSFTLDAGPNVHVLYKNKNKNQVGKLIREEFVQHCENAYWINDSIGSGPNKISF